MFFFQAEDGIRDTSVTGVQTCALPISFKASSDGVVASASGVSCFSTVESDSPTRVLNLLAIWPKLWIPSGQREYHPPRPPHSRSMWTHPYRQRRRRSAMGEFMWNVQTGLRQTVV